MAITAKQVKELREMTGAGMMDCKKALTATEGDFDKAIEFLREKGLATAEKKAGRVAAEGLVKVIVSDDKKKAVAVDRLRCKERKIPGLRCTGCRAGYGNRSSRYRCFLS